MMEISVQISYYPLSADFNNIVEDFIGRLSLYPALQLDTGIMSSLITGEYEIVMTALKETMQPYLEQYPSVFNIVIASACKQCKT